MKRFFSVRSSPLLAAALGALALAGCHQPAAAEVDKDNKTEPAPIAIAVATAHQQRLERTAEVQGALFPREHAVMSSEVEGRVAEVGRGFRRQGRGRPGDVENQSARI